MTFPYKHVLVIGATAGIGKALADRLVEAGTKVTAVGRRQDRLDEFVKKHGESKASAFAFDLLKKDQIPGFVSSVFKAHPDIDSVFLNSGIQHVHDFTKPEAVNLDQFFDEMKVNFDSFVVLTHAVLPYLQAKKEETSLIYTTSNLSIIPAAPMPAYSASKAALNAFILCLREQLRNGSVKIIDLSPPAVQTELHDYMGPEKGRNIGMPLPAFTEAAFKGLTSGSDHVIVGSIGPEEAFKEIVDKRRALFNNLSEMMRNFH